MTGDDMTPQDDLTITRNPDGSVTIKGSIDVTAAVHEACDLHGLP